MKPTFKTALKLCFRPKSFLEDEKLYHLDQKVEGKPFGNLGDKKILEYRKRISNKRRRLGASLLLVLMLVFLGAVIAKLFNNYYPLSWDWIRIIRAISLVILAWAAVSKLEDIKTMAGNTLLEQTSAYVFKRLYCLGVYLASFSLFLVGTNGV